MCLTLEDPAVVREALGDITVVLNSAGPFQRTAKPLIDACLHTGAHYLDLAGEVPEFRLAAGRDEEARAAGVMLLPGAGFGVVPTGSLAVHLHRRPPDADRLEIAFQTIGGIFRGTATTLLRDLPRTGVRLHAGVYLPQWARSHHYEDRLRHGTHHRGRQPLARGSVTSSHSTGIRTIDTCTALPAPVRVLMKLAARMPAVFTSSPWRGITHALVRRLPPGPSEAALADGSSHIWAQASTQEGQRVAAVLHGPDAYEFTARTAQVLLQRTLDGQATPGFQAPASAHGPDLVLTIPDASRQDLA
ncbi:hypothetical protein AB0F07_32230 [Streptomyces fructofermentans]|uniref:saccharopine dehydrogenase family protein n=1 Tax=Streptomyces fructofermentans TaxID=152141 RepID=UPI0034034E79